MAQPRGCNRLRSWPRPGEMTSRGRDDKRGNASTNEGGASQPCTRESQITGKRGELSIQLTVYKIAQEGEAINLEKRKGGSKRNVVKLSFFHRPTQMAPSRLRFLKTVDLEAKDRYAQCTIVKRRSNHKTIDQLKLATYLRSVSRTIVTYSGVR